MASFWAVARRPRWIAALLLCLGFAAGFAALGQWQLSRSVDNAQATDAPDTEDAVRFGEALDWALRKLALDIVRDGEGSKRIGRVVVRGGSDGVVETVARAVANSPLVKAALHGGDPNWGRIAQSVGMAMPNTAPLFFDVKIEGVQVCKAGNAIPHDKEALSAAVAGEEVECEVVLPGDGAETEVFFSDLSHEYVTINADYTT